MAASGIAEHNEARRKERSMQRLAFKKQALGKSLRDHYGDNADLLGMGPDAVRDTYVQEVQQSQRSGSPPGRAGSNRHDPQYVDRMRRNQLRQDQMCEYSAKIPNRYSSIDYASQW
ncbi:uncharacterized protein LOC128240179 [Mya arenaria]|uniref:uncharacterized protein LOC128240179 n=1 Tax=Mya arenaria TaxID=6604 RepID=UPI0022DFC423|nr:uncharacterized protein LOC128240179 [Mya arenaria]XP_052812660.1 uncharacterized protein LOC128240179 [Mya arenaria]